MKIIKKISRQLIDRECETDRACPAIFETNVGTLCIIGDYINYISDDKSQKNVLIKISKELLLGVNLGE